MEPVENRRPLVTYHLGACQQQTLHQHYRAFRNVLHRNPSFINPVYRTRQQTKARIIHNPAKICTYQNTHKKQTFSVLHSLNLRIHRYLDRLFPTVYAKEKDSKDLHDSKEPQQAKTGLRSLLLSYTKKAWMAQAHPSLLLL